MRHFILKNIRVQILSSDIVRIEYASTPVKITDVLLNNRVNNKDISLKHLS